MILTAFNCRWHVATCAILLAAATPVSAATYYVSTTGSDNGTGTFAAPWRTIGKAAEVLRAGDSAIIRDGDYDEHVHVENGGSAGAYVTFKAENPGQASLRAFRLSAEYVKLDGLKLNRYSGVGDTWGAAVRVEASAHHAVIANCEIVDLPSVIAHDFSFDHTQNRIRSPSSDFLAAGFVPGSKVYLGASGATVDGKPLYYANHDTTWTVAEVEPTSMTLTGGSAPFAPDEGSDYWAFVRAGTANTGFQAIQLVVSGGGGPQNVVISGNRISNWAGHAIVLAGDGHLVENNYLTNLLSFRFLSYSGSNHIIRYNVVKDATNILHYSADEMNTLIHPPGTGWYDYQVGMLSGFVSTGNHQNILIERNWFENVENQLGRVDDELEGAFDITFNANVFIGVSDHFSGGRDGMKWTNNTFFRCGFGTLGAAHPLQIGGRPPQQTGYEIVNNLFVACGPLGVSQTSTRGFYSISENALAPVADFNMVASEEVTGWAAKSNFTEVNGINGGDPVFLSTIDFMGPDNEPFTEDDGLQVLPNSPAAALGGGALGVYQVVDNLPVAHFTVMSPLGWFEPVGDAYNPQWFTQLPTRRGALQRPFDTPPSLGNVPVEVTFSAESSISGVGGRLTNEDIVEYKWDFADGPPVSTIEPSITHTFRQSGDKLVKLTVRNSAGNIHTTTGMYRFTGDRPSPPKNLGVVQE